ncbi:MAG: DUF177 domain-containing protein [Clostridia bacterium]|nr:DUF177 domain-containing protein [Clostridia bacterium]
MLDLIDVLNNEGCLYKFSKEYSPEPQEFMGGTLRFEEPFTVTGHVKNMQGAIEIFANVKGSLKTECARCGDDARYCFSFEYFDEVAHEGYEDGIELIGTKIDLGGAVLGEILSNLPMSILCKPDCKGLCPKCGANLNNTTCNCPSVESDAVWEKLKLLNLKDEV